MRVRQASRREEGEEGEGRGEAREGWAVSRGWEEVTTKGVAGERGKASRDFGSWEEMMVICDEESSRIKALFYTCPEQLPLG